MAAPDAPAQKTLLLVDDDKENLELLQRIFRSEYRLLTASSGEEGLKLIQGDVVDVIITDQKMPGMSGVQMLEKSLSHNPKIVKIILSAYTDTADILSAINVCRINHYLVKPVEPKKLQEVVAAALELVPLSARYD